jgi:hypothetical protein
MDDLDDNEDHVIQNLFECVNICVECDDMICTNCGYSFGSYVEYEKELRQNAIKAKELNKCIFDIKQRIYKLNNMISWNFKDDIKKREQAEIFVNTCMEALKEKQKKLEWPIFYEIYAIYQYHNENVCSGIYQKFMLDVQHCVDCQNKMEKPPKIKRFRKLVIRCIKYNLHKILKLEDTVIYYKRMVFRVDNNGLIYHFNLICHVDDLIRISKPMKYKTKNRYLKGYNKN